MRMATLRDGRRLAALVAMLAAVLVGAAAHAQTSAELLVGRWDLVSQQRIADGREAPAQPVSDKTRSTMVFTADGTWQLVASAPLGSHGTYRWLGPGRIESTTIKAPVPSGNGVTRTLSVEVDDRQLKLTMTLSAEDLTKVNGPARAGAPYPQTLTVVSTLRRLPD